MQEVLNTLTSENFQGCMALWKTLEFTQSDYSEGDNENLKILVSII